VCLTPADLSDTLTRYRDWLARQPLAIHSRRTYATHVAQFLAYLGAMPAEYGDPLREPHARDYAVRDFKGHLKTVRRAKPTSVNLALAAIDHFYRFLGLDRPAVAREDLPQQAPRALQPADQVRFLRAVERCPSIRDQALARLFFYTGLRLGEVAALDDDDVRLSARKGMVIVRAGKGDAYREVPLHREAREALDAWRRERARRFPATTEPACFLNQQGRRLTARAIDLRIRQLGEDAGLDLSAHILRHTCLTLLVRNGTDLVLVAELAGHRRLETTRRYSLPSAADRQAAIDGLRVEY
jgi:integrase/recombinase XerC